MIAGTRPNEIHNFGSSSNGVGGHQTHLKRELPQDLSEKELLKEAALVLAQAERAKCTTDTEIGAGGRLNDRLLLEGEWFESNFARLRFLTQ